MRVLVTGAGGAIGGWLTKRLLDEGHNVRCVDQKPFDQWYQLWTEADNRVADLVHLSECMKACVRMDEVYNLAADMGGIGHIESHKADCMLSVLVSTNMLKAARFQEDGRFFFSSSACAYAAARQASPDVTALREDDAYPAEPEDGYGWEKLFTERMCRHFSEDFGLTTRVARYHNVYCPRSTMDGGREKAPAALCRKVAVAAITRNPTIDVWGDGTQTRSFMYVDDCTEGTLRIMRSDFAQPLNLGSNELISIDDLAYLIADIAGIQIVIRHNLDAPVGVAGRNSDNTLIKQVLGWEPSIPLRTGLEKTYTWVYDQVKAQL